MGASSFMRQVVIFIANAYLVVFSLDALLGLADAVTTGGLPATASLWRRPTLTATLEGALPLYLLLGFSPRLPKRALLLPLLFLLCPTGLCHRSLVRFRRIKSGSCCRASTSAR